MKTAFAVAILLATAACKPSAETVDCAKYYDKVGELVLAVAKQDGQEKAAKADIDARRAEAIEACKKNMKPAIYKCVMASKTAEEMSHCDEEPAAK